MQPTTRSTTQDLLTLAADAVADLEQAICEGFDLDEGRAGKTKALEIAQDYQELLSSLGDGERGEVESTLGPYLEKLKSLAELLPGEP